MENSPFEIESTGSVLNDNPLDQAMREVKAAEAQEEILKQEQVAAEADATVKDDPVEQKEERRKLELKDIQAAAKTAADGFRSVQEMALAPGAGAADAAIDFLNAFPKNESMEEVYRRNRGLIPTNEHGDIPKLPEFKNKLAQSFRVISSYLLPNIFGAKGLTAAGVKAQAATGAMAARGNKVAGLANRLGRDKIVGYMSRLGINTGVGVGVDYFNSESYEGHNLSGTLKESWPEFYEWIPDDIATLTTDHPDVKRDKNVKEGVAIGIFPELVESLALVARGVKGITNLRGKFIPENETAEAFFSNPANYLDKTKTAREADPMPNLDVLALSKAESVDEIETLLEHANLNVENNVARRMDELDELGMYRAENDTAMDEPLAGLHDLEGTEEGIRATDADGVVGVMKDAAMIQTSKGSTYGRLGSIATEAAIKYGLDVGEDISRRTLINSIIDSIRKAGKFSYKDRGVNLSWGDIKGAGDELGRVLFDPRMTVEEMRRVLHNPELMNLVNQTNTLSDVGVVGVAEATKKYINEYFSLDAVKAQAYLTHSLAGQASDMAEGMRLMEASDAVSRAQEQIIDRITYLMAEKGLAAKLRGQGLANMNLWKWLRKKSKRSVDDVMQSQLDEAQDALSSSIKRAQQYRETLHNIRKSNPDFLKPLMLVNELTDGNVDSMYKLNHWMQNKLGTVGKMFIDGTPEISSEVTEALMGNLYNSMLSSLSTPAKAGFGNTAMLLEKPIAHMWGAVSSRDLYQMRKGWYMYHAFAESLIAGMRHMGMVFRKASMDPNSVPYIIREDRVARNQDTLAVMRETANAYAANGEHGPEIMLDIVDNLNDLAEHPLLRLGLNQLSGLDGFARAFAANAEARGRAFDEVMIQQGRFDGKAVEEARQKYYNSMFNEDGFIIDDAVDYTTKEISMSLDTEATAGLSMIMKHFPMIRPFFMFPKTSMNMVGAFAQRSAPAIFVGEYNKIVGLPGKKHTVDEIKDILQERGIPFDDMAEKRFRSLQMEYKGRVGMANTLLAGIGFYTLTDRIRGDGHYDKETQRVREENEWKKRTIQWIDGKWYSYDGFGPASDFIAFAATVMDNFDLVSTPVQEEWHLKLAFMLASSITNRSVLTGIQPFTDILSGNPGSWARWSASYSSSLLPASGARADLGRLLYPAMRQLEQEYGQMMRNRNAWMDAVDPSGALPVAYDYIDGEPIRKPTGFWQRVVHAYSPVKQFDNPSPLRKFLIDMEFDQRPTFSKSSDGVEFTPTQRSELQSIMGKQGYFKREATKVMNEAKNMGFLEDLKQARRPFPFGQGLRSDELSHKDYKMIYNRLKTILRDAVRLAEPELSDIDDIYQQAADRRRQTMDAEMGIINYPNK